MKEDIFEKDKRLHTEVSFIGETIHLKKLLRILSIQTKANFQSAPQYQRDYLFVSAHKIQCRFLLDAITVLYGAYWEKIQNTYHLQYVSHNEEEHLKSLPAGQRAITESFSQVRRTLDQAPESVQRALHFSEGKNASIAYEQLPASLKSSIKNSLEAIQKMHHSHLSPQVNSLLENPQNSKIGLRITQGERPTPENIEFQIFNSREFYSTSVSDSCTQIENQKRGVDTNNPKTRSYLSALNIKSKNHLGDNSKNKNIKTKCIVSADYPKILPSDMIRNITKQCATLMIICEAKENIKYYGFEKTAFKADKNSIDVILDKLCEKYKYIDWHVTSTDIVVIHPKY